MRIVVAHSQLRWLGGGERCTLELLRGLSRRHEVTLWTGSIASGHTFPELAAYPRRTLTAIEWLTARPNVDVVIAQTFGAYLLALRHPHVICYAHTLRSRYLSGGRRPDLAARRWLDRRALRRCSHLLTNSQFSAEFALRRYGRAAEVVPPGVEGTFLARPRPSSVGEYALYVGRLAPEKGLERLLAWMDNARMPLRLVGEGPPDYVRHLRSLAPGTAEFVGPRTGDALIDEYAGCRFLTYLPHDEEFGMAALEAMASGKPVIGSREGGLPELVRDGVSGFLVGSAAECANAVHRLQCDDELCLRMGSAGREIARAFTWERFVARIEDICAQSLTNTGEQTR